MIPTDYTPGCGSRTGKHDARLGMDSLLTEDRWFSWVRYPRWNATYSWIQTSYPFSNEKGLLMGETTQGGAKETANSADAIMTIEQLQAFALQRCTTAREAIELMGSLAVEYGYRESCSHGRGLTIADGEEVWWFEIYGVGPL